jgi:hypothetical protein
MPKTFKTSKQKEVAAAWSGKMQWWMVDEQRGPVACNCRPHMSDYV